MKENKLLIRLILVLLFGFLVLGKPHDQWAEITIGETSEILQLEKDSKGTTLKNETLFKLSNFPIPSPTFQIFIFDHNLSDLVIFISLSSVKLRGPPQHT